MNGPIDCCEGLNKTIMLIISSPNVSLTISKLFTQSSSIVLGNDLRSLDTWSHAI